MKKIILAAALGITMIIGLSFKQSNKSKKYGVFRVENDSTIIMNGVINGRTDKHFDLLISDHPGIKWIVLENCPGSMNDEVNLNVSKKIYNHGINTALKKTSEIASGAVDMFLAGNKRTLEKGAKVGVHSWRGLFKSATDFPEEHENHKLYIDYYQYIGMDNELSHSFYFFTIHSAPAKSIHWMTQEELMNYQFER